LFDHRTDGSTPRVSLTIRSVRRTISSSALVIVGRTDEVAPSAANRPRSHEKSSFIGIYRDIPFEDPFRPTVRFQSLRHIRDVVSMSRSVRKATFFFARR